MSQFWPGQRKHEFSLWFSGNPAACIQVGCCRACWLAELAETVKVSAGLSCTQHLSTHWIAQKESKHDMSKAHPRQRISEDTEVPWVCEQTNLIPTLPLETQPLVGQGLNWRCPRRGPSKSWGSDPKTQWLGLVGIWQWHVVKLIKTA